MTENNPKLHGKVIRMDEIPILEYFKGSKHLRYVCKTRMSYFPLSG